MKITVRMKLLGGFLIVVALLLVVGLVAITKLRSINDVTRQLSDNGVPSVEAVGAINGRMNAYRKDQLRYVTTPDAESRPGFLEDLRAGGAEIEAELARLRRLSTGAEDLAATNAFATAWKRYVDVTAAIAQTPSTAAGMEILVGGGGKPAFDASEEALATMQRFQSGLADRQGDDADDTVASARTVIVVLLIVAVLAAIAIALLLSRQISSGLRQMVAAARGIARGDIEQQVDVSSRDELGDAAEAFRAMIAYLDEMAVAARSIADGELDVTVTPKSDRDALGSAFALMSAQLREALGDDSCLDALVERMEQLGAHDMTALEQALAAVAAGDLTVDAPMTTTAITAADGRAPAASRRSSTRCWRSWRRRCAATTACARR